jgi:hypothetical protein
VSCVLLPSDSCLVHLSTDKSLPWAYPSVDCRPCFVDSGAPGGGSAYILPSKPDGNFFVNSLLKIGSLELILRINSTTMDSATSAAETFSDHRRYQHGDSSARGSTSQHRDHGDQLAINHASLIPNGPHEQASNCTLTTIIQKLSDF